jgi:hypothetical protein
LTIGQELDGAGVLSVRPSLDIWHRAFGTMPDSATSATTSPGVVAGVISHVAERLAAGEANAPDGAPAVASVGAIFDEARRLAVPLRVLKTPGDASALPYSPDALARLTAALESGHIAVAPERPIEFVGAPRAGWWLVDPTSGAVADQLDTGGGQAGEYVQTNAVPVTAAGSLRHLYTCLALVSFAAGATLAGFIIGGFLGGIAISGGGYDRSVRGAAKAGLLSLMAGSESALFVDLMAC